MKIWSVFMVGCSNVCRRGGSLQCATHWLFWYFVSNEARHPLTMVPATMRLWGTWRGAAE